MIKWFSSELFCNRSDFSLEVFEVEIVKNIVTILFVIDCLFLTIVVLMQEGKETGLGAIAGGSSDSYWSKNKNRSAQGALAKATKLMAVIFFVAALVLNLKWFN